MFCRSGPSVAPTVTTAGTPNTSPRVYSFTEDARPVLVTNLDAAVPLFVKLNAADASATDFDYRIPAVTGAGIITTKDVSNEGTITIKTMSIFGATGVDYDTDIEVKGWLAR